MKANSRFRESRFTFKHSTAGISRGWSAAMKAFKTGTIENAVLVVLLAISGSMNAILAHKVKAERQITARIKAEGQLQTGTWVPNIQGKTPEGKKTGVDYAANSYPTVVYVFTPTCEWCKRNFK